MWHTLLCPDTGTWPDSTQKSVNDATRSSNLLDSEKDHWPREGARVTSFVDRQHITEDVPTLHQVLEQMG